MAKPEEAEPVLETQLVPSLPRPPRLGGWLLLSLATLSAFPLQFVAAVLPAWIALQQHGIGPIWQQDRQWILVTGWAVGSTGAMAIYSLWTLPPFWRKRAVARRLMIAFYVGGFAVGIANYVLKAVLAAPGAPPPSILLPLVSTAIAAAWVRYFTSSERVRQTFVLP